MNHHARAGAGDSVVDLLVVGAGPAGLTAAEEACRFGMRPLVIEAGSQVGGISRTVVWDGNRIDIGGHRFFSKEPLVLERWQEWLGDAMIRVPRLSRIHYGGRFYDYPLSLPNVVRNFGLFDLARAGASFIRAALFPRKPERTFEDWVTNRFGRFLYERFFKTYTEKVWGIPCDQLRADWAAQRIRGLSLPAAVLASLGLRRGVRTLTTEFLYPRLGPGQMWERVAEKVTGEGGAVALGERVQWLRHDDDRIVAVETMTEGGGRRQYFPGQVVSTMPLGHLVAALDPPAPDRVLAAARALKHRDFLVVALRVRREGLFPDNWVYIHDAGFRVGRIQNAGNWSPELVAVPGTSLVLMEYFCSRGDDLWSAADADLIAAAGRELAALGFAEPDDMDGGHVIRQRDAYPVYDEHYRANLEILRDYLERFENLAMAGRSGLHRYNNQDHAMLSAIVAVRGLAGREALASWDLDIDRAYQEEQVVARGAA